MGGGNVEDTRTVLQQWFAILPNPGIEKERKVGAVSPLPISYQNQLQPASPIRQQQHNALQVAKDLIGHRDGKMAGQKFFKAAATIVKYSRTLPH